MAVKRSRKRRNVNIPLDLTSEILKKLPAKPLMRCLCVSKHWKTIIRDFIVINSIVTRSLTQLSRDPHFIFRMSSSFVLASFLYAYPDEKQLYHGEVFEISRFRTVTEFQYVRGLIGFWSFYYPDFTFTIHNPTTSQSVSLPNISSWKPRCYLFGYDPMENQYKVVRIPQDYLPSCQVFTLGDPKKQWRNIECSIEYHRTIHGAICINGAIYYKACTLFYETCILASFDVRSEEFNDLQAPENMTAHFSGDSSLVNYQGKLGCIYLNKVSNDVDLWVMEDAKKQEWSKITVLSMLQDLPSNIRISGVTHPGGEIVLVRETYSKETPLEFYYCDPNRNSRRSVEIKTAMPTDSVQIWAVTDHVENTMCNSLHWSRAYRYKFIC